MVLRWKCEHWLGREPEADQGARADFLDKEPSLQGAPKSGPCLCSSVSSKNSSPQAGLCSLAQTHHACSCSKDLAQIFPMSGVLFLLSLQPVFSYCSMPVSLPEAFWITPASFREAVFVISSGSLIWVPFLHVPIESSAHLCFGTYISSCQHESPLGRFQASSVQN